MSLYICITITYQGPLLDKLLLVEEPSLNEDEVSPLLQVGEAPLSRQDEAPQRVSQPGEEQLRPEEDQLREELLLGEEEPEPSLPKETPW